MFKVLFSTGPKRDFQHPKHIHMAWHTLNPLDISSEFRVKIESCILSDLSMRHTGISGIILYDLAPEHPGG